MYITRMLYIDDLREPPKICDISIDIARTANHAKELLNKGHYNIVSFDHDLGEDEPTGYDILKWMLLNEIIPEEIWLHTANPVGRGNMSQYVSCYNREMGTSIRVKSC